MADWHFAQATTWSELLAVHDQWVADYNFQSHWAHRERQDGRLSPAAVLDRVCGRLFRPDELERIFRGTRFGRLLNRFGYVRFRHWRVYGERGLAGARLDDIARRAGVSKGTIYLYFPNKEELFREVVRAVVVDRLRQAAANAGTGDPVQELERYLRAHWDFVRSPAFQTIFRLVTGELHNFPDLAEFYGREVIKPGNRVLADVIQRGIDRGIFRRVDPILSARLMASTAITHSTWCARRNLFNMLTDVTDEQVFDQLLDFFFHAIRTTPATDPTSRADKP
jgi:AcrR family transcriptional regulator